MNPLLPTNARVYDMFFLQLTRPQGEHQRRRSLGQDSARNDFAKSAVETTFPNESFSDNDGFQTETLLEVLRGENSGTSPRGACVLTVFRVYSVLVVCSRVDVLQWRFSPLSNA